MLIQKFIYRYCSCTLLPLITYVNVRFRRIATFCRLLTIDASLQLCHVSGWFLPRYVTHERGIAAASSLSVCPSVMLRYRDHIGRNSSKIISRLVSVGCSLSADPNITGLLKRKYPIILGRSDPLPVEFKNFRIKN